MNEKIKSLALQSMANVRFWNAENESYEVGHDELEKFAELLVNECCQMMIDMETKYPANLTIREIKKHFGV